MTNKEAITVLKNHISPYDDCMADNEVNQAIRLAIKALEGSPQGEWISDYRTCKCSVCNFTTVIDTYNFCPNCGADMRKGGAE